MLSKIKELLGKDADTLLSYKAKFPKEQLNLPGPDFVDRIFANTNRNINVLKNLEWIYQTGRLAGNRLCFNSSCRSGNRTLRRSMFCAQSILF